jgi:hypothetical protein
MTQADWIGAILGLCLTLGVFSYLLGDNPVFRLIIHVFIGVTAAFVIAASWYSIIWPQLIQPILSGDDVWSPMVLVGIVLGVLLFSKISFRLSWLGIPVMGLLVGVGAATAIGGAVLGTVLSQVAASIRLFDFLQISTWNTQAWVAFLDASLVLVGTLVTLLYFQFFVRKRSGSHSNPSSWRNFLGLLGQGFIAVTLGAIFAGVYSAAVTALVGRLASIKNLFALLFHP